MGGMRKRWAAVICVAGLVAACGGGGDEETEDTVALEEIEPIVDIDPCDLIDDQTASTLSGAEVEAAESTTEEDGTTSCDFAFADAGVADDTGSAIAASLSIGPGDEGDVPGGATARSLRIGDRSAVEEEEQKVRVVYIVREVVVRVEVVPGDGEVDDELVDEVIEFTETTEGPVTEAVTGEPFEPTTTTGATTTTIDDEIPEGDPIAVDGAAVSASVDRAGGLDSFIFEGETGDVIFVSVPAATRQPADAGGCLAILLKDPDDFTVNSTCAREDGTAIIDRTELDGTGVYQIVFDPDAQLTGTAQIQITSATDQQGTISVDGPAVGATVTDLGAMSRFTFSGRTGDAIFVAVPAATRQPVDAGGCLTVRIEDPDNFTVNSTCAREDGTAFIDRTELAASGTYTIVFDPDATLTGTAQIQVTNAG